ncbi:MAG: DsbA family protein [Nitratireductor sp.]
MKMNRRYLLQGTAVALLGTAGISYFGGQEDDSLIVSKAHAQDLSDLMEPGPLEEMFYGEENAPITIIEYASMTCPHCANFHIKVLPELKEKFIDTGKVKLIFREFPFDPRAFAAFMMARCAPKEFYFPMIDVLFQQQARWARSQDPRVPLLQIGKLAGFTQESFNACLKNQELLDNVNSVKLKGEKQYGVNATPFFFINGEKYSGKNTVEGLSQAIEALL